MRTALTLIPFAGLIVFAALWCLACSYWPVPAEKAIDGDPPGDPTEPRA